MVITVSERLYPRRSPDNGKKVRYYKWRIFIGSRDVTGAWFGGDRARPRRTYQERAAPGGLALRATIRIRGPRLSSCTPCIPYPCFLSNRLHPLCRAPFLRHATKELNLEYLNTQIVYLLGEIIVYSQSRAWRWMFNWVIYYLVSGSKNQAIIQSQALVILRHERNHML
jgi:hypothetical protein